MLENYLLKGMVIGLVFGVPAGAVGVLSVQRVLARGAFAGLITGIGSSVVDVFYACIGVFGITIISDFLFKYQSFICIIGCLMVTGIGVQTFRKRGRRPLVHEAVELDAKGQRGLWPQMLSCFLSSFTIAITNPAAILSFMMAFSIFRVHGTESMGENLQLVFGIFCGTCIWWIAIAVSVSLFRKRMTERIYQNVNRVFGAFLILFGIVIGVQGCLLR